MSFSLRQLVRRILYPFSIFTLRCRSYQLQFAEPSLNVSALSQQYVTFLTILFFNIVKAMTATALLLLKHRLLRFSQAS